MILICYLADPNVILIILLLFHIWMLQIHTVAYLNYAFVHFFHKNFVAGQKCVSWSFSPSAVRDA